MHGRKRSDEIERRAVDLLESTTTITSFAQRMNAALICASSAAKLSTEGVSAVLLFRDPVPDVLRAVEQQHAIILATQASIRWHTGHDGPEAARIHGLADHKAGAVLHFLDARSGTTPSYGSKSELSKLATKPLSVLGFAATRVQRRRRVVIPAQAIGLGLGAKRHLRAEGPVYRILGAYLSSDTNSFPFCLKPNFWTSSVRLSS